MGLVGSIATEVHSFQTYTYSKKKKKLTFLFKEKNSYSCS